jgi:hypothetical protein
MEVLRKAALNMGRSAKTRLMRIVILRDVYTVEQIKLYTYI